MIYHKKILSFFEALYYLFYRFADDRTGKEIEKQSIYIEQMPKEIRACIRDIAALEHELDEKFAPDDLMRYYFTPMQTKEKRPFDYISLGAMLLSIPEDMKPPFTFDALCDYFRNTPQESVLLHFCNDVILPPFCETLTSCKSFEEFIEVIDSALLQPEDKWRIINAASNPLHHLEKLRKLVCDVSDHIEKKRGNFDLLVKMCSERFTEDNLAESIKKLNVCLDPDEIENAVVYPSIFLFNGILIIVPQDKNIRIHIGVFFDKSFQLQKKTEDITNYLSMLKVLSDGTRLAALKEMCGKYTFGQELAEKVGGSRNAMYYHLEKLYGNGLIDCKTTDYRMLYTMNKKAVYEKLTALRDYLTDGWQPGDEEFPEDDADRKQDG